VAGATACRDAAADADAEGVTAGCDAAEDADADAGADVDAGAEAGALEVTGVVADDEEAGDEVHPATPAPATSATAPAAARRPVRRPASLVEPSISNPISPRPRRRSSTMSRNLAVYTPFRDDVRFAVVSGRL
jgi:hypothetical protein